MALEMRPAGRRNRRLGSSSLTPPTKPPDQDIADTMQSRLDSQMSGMDSQSNMETPGTTGMSPFQKKRRGQAMLGGLMGLLSRRGMMEGRGL